MSQPDDRDLLRRAEAAYVEFFRGMARTAPQVAIHEERGLTLVFSGPWLPQLNVASLDEPEGDPSAAIQQASEFFAVRGHGFALTAPLELAQLIAPSATAAGLARFATSDRMLLESLDGSAPEPPFLRVEAARDAALLRVYNETMTAGFGGSAWAADEILADAALLRCPDAAHYVGFVDGRPVATAMLHASLRVAVIANVSTVPGYRRRGIGEAITRRAVLDGRARGCIAAYLQASEMGAPVYERMGFRHVRPWQMWLSPDPVRH